MSTARASRLIQPSSFPRLTPFRCNVRYARRDDRDGEVEGKEETGHRSVRWFNHRYRKVDFSPLFTFFFCRGNPPRLGNEGIYGGLTMRNSRLIEEGIRGKQDGVFFYGFIFQLIDMYLTSEKLEFYIGCNRDK